MDKTTKEHIITLLKALWKMQTLQFDYLSHAKASYVMWHIVGFVSFLILGKIHRYLCGGTFLFFFSWNYFFLFDKTKRGYKDCYAPRFYEFIGTISVTFIISLLLLLLCFFDGKSENLI